MKKTLITAFLLAATSMFGADFNIGINIGAPPPPRVIRARPVAPGPDYIWVDGYWYPVGNHYKWHAGYWSRPPYPGAIWVVPRYEGGRYYNGYWAAGDRHWEHDHSWDRDHRRRDFDHDRDHDHDHGHH